MTYSQSNSATSDDLEWRSVSFTYIESLSKCYFVYSCTYLTGFHLTQSGHAAACTQADNWASCTIRTEVALTCTCGCREYTSDDEQFNSQKASVLSTNKSPKLFLIAPSLFLIFISLYPILPPVQCLYSWFHSIQLDDFVGDVWTPYSGSGHSSDAMQKAFVPPKSHICWMFEYIGRYYQACHFLHTLRCHGMAPALGSTMKIVRQY